MEKGLTLNPYMHELLIKDAQNIAQLSCKYLEEQLAKLRANPDDPEVAGFRRAMEEGLLKFTVFIPFIRDDEDTEHFTRNIDSVTETFVYPPEMKDTPTT